MSKMPLCPKCKTNGLFVSYAGFQPHTSCYSCGFLYIDGQIPDSLIRQIDTTEQNLRKANGGNTWTDNLSKLLSNGSKTPAPEEASP